MASMVSVRFRKDMRKLDALEAMLPHKLDKGVKQLAEDIVQHMRDNWSPEPPSIPGTPPAVRTGDLDVSMETKQARGLGGMFSSHYLIIFNDPATAALEFGYPPNNLAPRPFIVPAFVHFGIEVADRFDDLFSFT